LISSFHFLTFTEKAISLGQNLQVTQVKCSFLFFFQKKQTFVE